MKKKQVSKKKANEGRGVKCRRCHTNMKQQMNLHGQWDYMCEKCGFRWVQHEDPAVWVSEDAV